MLARCPKNPDHKRFVTTAHVMQDWMVDEKGEYLEEVIRCVEVTHDPHPDNLWTCYECGETAVVTK